DRTLGILAIHPTNPTRIREPDGARTIQALASQTALALERCHLAEAAEHARTEAETERARSALLSSVSHDLRTPLAAITGGATSLLEGSSSMDERAKRDMAKTIAEEAGRLNRLIGDLLEMTRLESGALRVRKEWHSIEEVIGAALGRLDPELADRPVKVDVPPNLPLVPLDDVLFEQVVRNLVENANKYSPPGLLIEIQARTDGERLRFTVADRGSGLKPGEEQRAFEKFYRGAAFSDRAGVGLGLAICRGIVEAHGGTISASNRSGGGAEFTVLLPLEGAPPVVERAPEEEPGTR
ncbi:MAG: sensor histidine kinase, partial [Candidatus Eiseniibacteriota bacterium]